MSTGKSIAVVMGLATVRLASFSNHVEGRFVDVATCVLLRVLEVIVGIAILQVVATTCVIRYMATRLVAMAILASRRV